MQWPEKSNLDRDNARALHEQLSDRLRTELLSSRQPDEQIPTEKEIGEVFGLSRITVRRAIQTLVEQGALVRRQGKGTFVARPKPRIVYHIDRFGPFMAAFSDTDEKVSVELLNFAWVQGEKVPRAFKGERSALAYDRLYETDGFPHALICVTLPGRLGERVARADASSMGVYQILQERLSVPPVRANVDISSELPDVSLARKLRVSPSSPLLRIERVSYDRKGTAIESTTHHLLPEVYRLSVNLRAKGFRKKRI